MQCAESLCAVRWNGSAAKAWWEYGALKKMILSMNQQPNSVLRLTDFIFNNGQSVSEVGKEGRKI